MTAKRALRPRQGILDIALYVPGKSTVASGGPVIKLSSNETPFGPSPRAIEAYLKEAQTLSRYPDGSARALREAIAKLYGLDPARIVCGAGSDELLSLLATAYLGPGDEAIYSRHGFLVYRIVILARGATPVITRRALPGDPADDQARYIEAAVNGVLIASIYLPNGNPQPGPKFDYKLAWFERLISHAADLMAAGVPVILAGDYNVVPTEADIWLGHHEQDNALLQPETRAAFQRLLEQGWPDES